MTLNEELAKYQAKTTAINYGSKYIALAIVDGRRAEVLHTTTDSMLCSYGIPRWEDDWGNDYGQIEMHDLSIRIVSIAEIDDDLYDRLYGDDGDNDDGDNDDEWSGNE